MIPERVNVEHILENTLSSSEVNNEETLRFSEKDEASNSLEVSDNDETSRSCYEVSSFLSSIETIDYEEIIGITEIINFEEIEGIFDSIEIINFEEIEEISDSIELLIMMQCFKNRTGPTGRTVDRPQNRSGSIKKPFLIEPTVEPMNRRSNR